MPRFDDSTIELLFGADDAENEADDRFLAYFYYNDAYDDMRSNLPIRLLVGHKGVGKSALLKRSFLADKEEGKLSYWLRPNDLNDIKEKARSNPDFISRVETWKLGILRDMFERYAHTMYGAQAKELAVELEAARPRDFHSLLKKGLDENTKHKEITVYIDDIDRGWSANPDDIRNISALLNAVRDIAGEDRRLRSRIGLRSDVYFLVRTSDESTDKIERNVIWLRWSNDQILRLAAKRIETFFDTGVTQEQIEKLSQSAISKNILSKVIDPVFNGLGHWSNRPIQHVLLSLTRARPRDLVKLFYGAAKRARKDRAEIISSSNLNASFEAYSQERLQDIINEFRSELPNIEALLLHMRPTKK